MSVGLGWLRFLHPYKAPLCLSVFGIYQLRFACTTAVVVDSLHQSLEPASPLLQGPVQGIVPRRPVQPRVDTTVAARGADHRGTGDGGREATLRGEILSKTGGNVTLLGPVHSVVFPQILL